jgi:hypothetical protein
MLKILFFIHTVYIIYVNYYLLFYIIIIIFKELFIIASFYIFHLLSYYLEIKNNNLL